MSQEFGAPPRNETTPWRVTQMVAVVLVLGAFLYSTRSILNPVLLFFLLWAASIPFRGAAGRVGLLLIAGLLTVVWLLSTTGSLLAPFVLSVVLAYALDPLVDRMEAVRIPRALAIVLLTLPALGLLAVLVFLLIPAAVRQLLDVAQDVPVLLDRLADWLEGLRQRLVTLDIPVLDEDALLERLRGIDSASLTQYIEDRREALASWLWSGVIGVGRGIGSVFTVLGYVALTPVLTFYLLRDWDKIVAGLATSLPADRRPRVVAFVAESHRLIARYLRGQITVAIVIGTLTGLGLWVVGFPYAGTLGLIVAVFSVVPYLGLVLSLIPAIIIALVSGSVWLSLLKVVLVYGAAQLLEASVVSPRIVGESVGLHPVWVVLALALGGFFFGFVGLLIGVPVAAVSKLLILRGLDRYQASAFYHGGAAPAAESEAV
jgi:predicted PurR-regulated permease PerM